MRDDKVTVSVVVPAYNVAPYIRKCVTSIVNQTYSELEILVVDDGSNDDTSAILHELSCQYDQVKVIHQENRGVSAARNRGMDDASGIFIMFVDGDDYIAPDCVEYMLSLILRTNGDFCFSRCCFNKEGEHQTESMTMQSLSAEQVIAELLSPDVFVGCWNKLYRREFLEKNGIRFCEELFYGEGLFFIIACAQQANRVGVGNRKVYYYRRNNVNSATAKFDIGKIYNGEKSLRRIEQQIDMGNAKIRNMYLLHICTFYLGALVRLQTYRLVNAYPEDYRNWLRYIREHVPMLICSGEVRLYRALMLMTGCISPGIVAKLDVIRRKNIENSSVK